MTKRKQPSKKVKEPTKKGGAPTKKGKVDPQERLKDRPSFLLLALPTCQTQIHLNIPPFGVLGSKCSSTLGMRLFLKNMFLSVRTTKSTFKQMGRSSDPDDGEDSLPMFGGTQYS